MADGKAGKAGVNQESATPAVDDNEVQERDLNSFVQAEEFKGILFSSTFLPQGLGRFQDESDVAVRLEEVRHAAEDTRRRVAAAEELLRRLMAILDEYQEQSYLLDPHLESIVTPPVRALQSFVKHGSLEREDAQRMARLLYYYTKVRGHKTVLHFFPHAVDDFQSTLTALDECVDQAADAIWEYRYILLLWLSLICMIPFDLRQFDQNKGGLATAARIERIARHFLSSPGKERDAAAIVLARLYQRRDCGDEGFREFLLWAESMLAPAADPSTFLVAGVLQTVCNVVKMSTPTSLGAHLLSIRKLLTLFAFGEAKQSGSALPQSLVNNGTVNRYKSKMACRLGLKLLPPRASQSLRNPATILGQPHSQRRSVETGMANFEVPEEIDAYIAILLDFLRDKDTIVRYSAAKGLARLSGRLPAGFVEQIADEITSMFAIGIADLTGKAQDLSTVSEHTWQGCCLALAELARRGLLSRKAVSTELDWVEKALLFDVRRRAHSVGTGVRDAACYVIWSMARSHDADTLRPHASSLSQKMVCVALLDRDISIRRAASAAYQECVGRLGIFPHGIDVISKTDFFSVSVRRNAFLHCVPQVAEHVEYRDALIDHLMDVTLVHWDPAMRTLAADSLAGIVDAHFDSLALPVVQRLRTRCVTKDQISLHGVLAALAAIGRICKLKAGSTDADICRATAFGAMTQVRKPGARLPATDLILQAGCDLVANNAGVESTEEEHGAAAAFIDMALTRQDEKCHEAAARAIASVSGLKDLSGRVDETIQNWTKLSVAQRQASALAFGSYRFSTYSTKLETALRFLLSLVNGGSPSYSAHIETRRNVMLSLATILVNLDSKWSTSIPTPLIFQVWEAFLAGLEDYSTDARGDVGSWVRLASMRSLRCVTDLIASNNVNMAISDAERMRSIGCGVVAGLAKQMLERIDSVRTAAKISFLQIVHAYEAINVGPNRALVPDCIGAVTEVLTQAQGESVTIQEVYHGSVQLLKIDQLRAQVLKGIVLSIGPQRESLNRDLAANLTMLDNDTGYNLAHLTNDLAAMTVASVRNNRYFIPALQTFNVLLELGVYDDRVGTSEELLQVLRLATRSIDKVKSVARILAAAQLLTNMLRLENGREAVQGKLGAFLLHPYPTIRSSFAELLYVQWQSCFDDFPDEAEELLLSTHWPQDDISALGGTVEQIELLLRTSV